jgi:hypothetical protein
VSSGEALERLADRERGDSESQPAKADCLSRVTKPEHSAAAITNHLPESPILKFTFGARRETPIWRETDKLCVVHTAPQAERTGDFSGIAQQVYDPAGGALCPTRLPGLSARGPDQRGGRPPLLA